MPGKIIKRAWRFIVRMDVVSLLIIVLLSLLILGSFFPQLTSGLKTDEERLTQWEISIVERFGNLTAFLTRIGVFHFFNNPVLLVPLVLLVISTLLCTIDRWRSLWRRAFHMEVRCANATFEVTVHKARLTAPDTDRLISLVYQNLSNRGFRIHTEEVNDTLHIRADRYKLSPLGTLISHLGVMLMLVGILLTSAFGWREVLTISPESPAQISNGAIVHYGNFTIERYPDGSAADYQALIHVTGDNQITAQGIVRVNQPLHNQAIGYYLQGFEQADQRDTVTLLAVHDPGYSMVVLSGFLLLLGMTVSFYFPHCCIFGRIEPDGIISLAGRADKRACDFDREFSSLVDLLKRDVHGAIETEESPC